ncbi:MAG: DNA/RNA nuclease SfsA [Lachnospiraceae bacterium]|nr:DNA/RNA nuclease SfsA [Lachnospiraceae bacterium]
MKYQNIVHGRFHSRPNRFIAQVWVEDVLETVHVKNTGRCRELLLPNADVVLEKSDNPNRKTKYDLICVYKEGLGWVNIDSQAPNKVVAEWLLEQDYSCIKPEYTYGDSRIDFYMEKTVDKESGGKGRQGREKSGDENNNGKMVVEKYLMEVKGCTLEINGIGYFPDAPTTRGVKHLRELANAALMGYHCYVAFVIQMEGVNEVCANVATHAEFGVALEEAKAAGVKVLCLGCKVSEDALEINRVLEV